MTNELRVPTAAISAEIRMGGDIIRGRLFLPTLAYAHEGPMRPGEWLNQPGNFFPFLLDGADKPLILNKCRVDVLSVPAVSERVEDDTEASVCRSIQVMLHGFEMTGVVVIEMPVAQSRILDFVNGDEAFLTLWDADRCHFIRKTAIEKINEAREDAVVS